MIAETPFFAIVEGSNKLRPSKTIGVVIFSFTTPQVHLGEFRPLRRDHKRFCTVSCSKRVFTKIARS